MNGELNSYPIDMRAKLALVDSERHSEYCPDQHKQGNLLPPERSWPADYQSGIVHVDLEALCVRRFFAS